MSSSCALQSRYLDKLLAQLTSDNEPQATTQRLAREGNMSSAHDDQQQPHISELSVDQAYHLHFTFPDNGNWDDIFSSVGLEM